MDGLSASFILGYHGCRRKIGENILRGAAFQASDNDFDWLGPGIYFWEANPRRGLEFAREQSRRKSYRASEAFVVGAVIDLGLCLDLTTSVGVQLLRAVYYSLAARVLGQGQRLPTNSADRLRRNLDCAVIRRLHTIFEDERAAPFQSVRGVFVEGEPIYPDAGFHERTHVQIAVRDPGCIKGVFRVPAGHFV